MPKLIDIPTGSKIYEDMVNQDGTVLPGPVIYDHPDGMYSYCYLESDPSQIAHLSLGTPLIKHKDGYKIAKEK